MIWAMPAKDDESLSRMTGRLTSVVYKDLELPHELLIPRLQPAGTPQPQNARACQAQTAKQPNM